MNESDLNERIEQIASTNHQIIANEPDESSDINQPNQRCELIISSD